MKRCPRCGTSFPEEFTFCQNDAAALAPAAAGAPRARRRVAAATAAVLAALLVAALVAVVAMKACRTDRRPVRPATNAGQSRPASSARRSSPGTARRLWPPSARASSVEHTRSSYYPAEQAFDGNVATCWGNGVTGLGLGEWVEADFASPVHIASIVVIPGYDKYHPRAGDLFFLNGHLRRFTLSFSNGYTVARDVGYSERRVNLGGLDVTTTNVRLNGDGVWEGTRWHGWLLSEIEIYGE